MAARYAWSLSLCGRVRGVEDGQRQAPAGRFTLYDYASTPPGHRRLRRLPHLIRTAVRMVWQAASREFVTSAVLQTINGAALAVQLLLIQRLLRQLIAGDPFGDVWIEAAALALIGGVVAFSSVILDGRQRMLGAKVGMYTAGRPDRVGQRPPSSSPSKCPGIPRPAAARAAEFDMRPTQLANGLVGHGGRALRHRRHRRRTARRRSRCSSC